MAATGAVSVIDGGGSRHRDRRPRAACRGTGTGNVIAGQRLQWAYPAQRDDGQRRGRQPNRHACPGERSAGVRLDSSSGNTVGGTAAGAGNVITHNGGPGVQVVSGSGNQFSANSIFANAGPGIDTSVGPAVPFCKR